MSWGALWAREFHEHVRPSGKWSGHVLAAVVMAVLFGAGAAVATGLFMREFSSFGGQLHLQILVALASGIGGAIFTAILIPMNLGIESVAGERERHTLATLATLPLTDAQIVWAKMLAVVLVATGVAAVGGVAVWITLVVLYAGNGFLWGLLAVPGAAMAAFLPALCVTGWAVSLSTRAATVKDAGQRMALFMMPLYMMYPLSMFASDAMWFSLVAVPLAGLFLCLGPILALVRFRRERLLTV